MGTAGVEGGVWQREDCKGGKQEGQVASEEVLGQEFGQEIQVGKSEAAVDPLGSEEASEHILDLKDNVQVKIGVNE